MRRPCLHMAAFVVSFTTTRNKMFRRCSLRRFQSHTAATPTGSGKDGKETYGDKVKNEIKKMLKIQLVLIPIACVVLFWMFPPPSPEEERRLRAEYEKNAGWKT